MSRVVTWAIPTSLAVNGKFGAVVGHAPDAVEFAGVDSIEHEDLPATSGRRWRLAIHPHECRRLLDDSVRFAGDDVTVVGKTDVERLATAAQCQVERIRMISRGRADGHAALELGDRASERFAEVGNAIGDVTSHHRRDHLCIGRDRPGDAQPVADLDVGVIVDVAVEDSNHVRGTTGLLELLAVERVAVGFADDPDTCPTRVAEHGEPRIGLRQRQAQQFVGADRSAQRTSVVAELADLSGGLVHEAEARPCHAHRAVLEQRITVALEQHPLHRGVRHGQPVVPDEEVKTGGVATAHLESIERRQRLLHGQVAGDRSNGAIESRQCLDLACRAQTVVADRPRRVAEVDQLCCDRVPARRGRAHRRPR